MANQTIQSVIVGSDIKTVYKIWSNFENFPHFMKNIQSVTKLGDKLSRWAMSGPLGFNVEWDAETTTLEENSRIAWNSRDTSTITTSGQVTFKELPNNQTEVTVTLQYDPPAGLAGDIVAKVFSNPETRLSEDLQNFKHYAEGMQRTVG